MSVFSDPPAPQPDRLPGRSWWRGASRITGLVFVLVLGLLGGIFVTASATTTSVAAAPVLAQITQFDGRYLVAASDADMVGTAYADGVLRQVPGVVDTLSLVELPVVDSSARVIEIPASNSVTSWPQITAVAPDGNSVYVVETAAQLDDNVAQLATSEFPPGRLVTAIDISAGAEAARIATVDVGEGALHIAISADGAYLAVGLREQGRQLAILPTATLDDPSTFRYFPVYRAAGQPADRVTSVFWHPSGNFLAVGIDAQEVQFYRVRPDAAGAPLSETHGEPITGGYTLTYGQFTSDGRFYLTSEINWNRFPDPLSNLLNPPSEMLAISFDPSEAAQHAIVSRVPVGHSAEGFAISPQEDLLVTVNMRRTYLPDWLAFWPGAQLNSLSLLSFNRETGALTPIGEQYGFEGVLPEDAIFDADGDSLGVVIYNERERPLNPGYIEFWNVIRDGDAPRLERTAVRVPVVRGPHAMNVIP